jgi:hypothetical protein
MATVIGVLEPVKTSFAPALHIGYRASNHRPTCTLGQVSRSYTACTRQNACRDFFSSRLVFASCFLSVDLLPTRNLRCAARATYRPAHRSGFLPLPHRRKTRRRWHGRRLQSLRRSSSSFCCAEIPARCGRERRSIPGAVSTRGPGRVRAEPSEHPHDPRYWRSRRPGLYRHGIPRRANAEAS